MVSLYDVIADSCSALAARTKHKSDRLQLLQLADQWRTVPGDRQGPGKKQATSVPVTDNVNRAMPLSRPAPRGAAVSTVSASEEIDARKKQLASQTERAQKEAVERARNAIGVLQEPELMSIRYSRNSVLRTQLRRRIPSAESSPIKQPAQYVISKRTLPVKGDRTVDR
jgi:hypothetical protein